MMANEEDVQKKRYHIDLVGGTNSGVSMIKADSNKKDKDSGSDFSKAGRNITKSKDKAYKKEQAKPKPKPKPKPQPKPKPKPKGKP
jgi:protein TonB